MKLRQRFGLENLHSDKTLHIAPWCVNRIGKDATYLALAESMGIPLITNDRQLLKLQPVYPWIKAAAQA